MNSILTIALLSTASTWAASLSGTIYGEFGQGIADADVYAINTQLAAASTKSNPDGTYRFAGLPAGAYRVWALPPSTDPHVPRYHPEAADFCDGALVELSTDRQSIDLSLPPGDAITGFVFLSDGSVGTGTRIRADSVDGSTSREAYVDDSGRFEVLGLEPGDNWQLQAALSGTPVQWFGSVYRQQDAAEISPDQTATLGDWTLLEGIRVSGAVFGPDGPMPTATVRVYSSSQIVQAETDEDGLYSTTGLPPGEVTSWAAAEGFATTYYPIHDRPTEAVSVTAEGDWLEEMDLELPYQATASIQLEGLAPRTNGDLSGLSIILYNSSHSVGRAAATDSTGTAFFDRLHGGSYEAFVYGSEAGHPDDWVRTTGGALQRFEIEAESDNILPLAILAPATTVEGRVTGDDGLPVSGASIVLTSAESGDTGLEPTSNFYVGTTDSDGRFEIVGVPDGEWLARAQIDPLCPSDPGYVPVYWPDEVDPVMGEALEVDTSTPVNSLLFTLPRDDDHDAMGDRWEQRYQLDITRDDSAEDPDNDGLSNLTEYRLRTNPRVIDGEWITETRCGCSTHSPPENIVWMGLFLLIIRRRHQPSRRSKAP